MSDDQRAVIGRADTSEIGPRPRRNLHSRYPSSMTDHAISLNNDGVPVIPASGEISGGARPRCSSDPLRRIVVL